MQPIKELSSAAGLCAGRGYALIRQLVNEHRIYTPKANSAFCRLKTTLLEAFGDRIGTMSTCICECSLSVTASNAATHIKATGIASPAKMKQPVGVFDDDHQRDRRRPLWRP